MYGTPNGLERYRLPQSPHQEQMGALLDIKAVLGLILRQLEQFNYEKTYQIADVVRRQLEDKKNADQGEPSKVEVRGPKDGDSGLRGRKSR